MSYLEILLILLNSFTLPSNGEYTYVTYVTVYTSRAVWSLPVTFWQLKPAFSIYWVLYLSCLLLLQKRMIFYKHLVILLKYGAGLLTREHFFKVWHLDIKQMFIILFKCPGDLVKNVWHVRLFLCYMEVYIILCFHVLTHVYYFINEFCFLIME